MGETRRTTMAIERVQQQLDAKIQEDTLTVNGVLEQYATLSSLISQERSEFAAWRRDLATRQEASETSLSVLDKAIAAERELRSGFSAEVRSNMERLTEREHRAGDGKDVHRAIDKPLSERSIASRLNELEEKHVLLTNGLKAEHKERVERYASFHDALKVEVKDRVGNFRDVERVAREALNAVETDLRERRTVEVTMTHRIEDFMEKQERAIEQAFTKERDALY